MNANTQKHLCFKCRGSEDAQPVEVRIAGRVNKYHDQLVRLCAACRKSLRGEWRWPARSWLPVRQKCRVVGHFEFYNMNETSTQPDRAEHGPKQLRAGGQVPEGGRFAAFVQGYSSPFLTAGCGGKRSLPPAHGEISQAVCVFVPFIFKIAHYQMPGVWLHG